MKRKVDELESANDQLAVSEARLRKHTDALEQLVEILRTRPEHEVGSVVSRIRAGEQVESVVRLVRDGDLLLQLTLDPTAVPFCFQFPLVSSMPSFLLDAGHNPYIDSLLYQYTLGERGQRVSSPDAAPPSGEPKKPSSPATPSDDLLKMYQVPFHSAKLAEPRLDKVKASRWTSVTSSDSLVRDLLEIYFIHEFSYCTPFHLDYFLEDLVAGRERFCSPLLVNIILAIACHGHKGLDQRSRSHFWNPKSLYYQFMAEFKRLWELETSDVPKITTVQAGIIACVSHNVDGLDKVGTAFLAQAVDISQKMGLYTPSTYDSLSTSRREVYTVTAQGLSAWESIQSFCFFRAPMITTPPPPFPPLDQVHHSRYAGELWLLYPGAQHPVPCHHGLTFRAIVGFRQIMNEVAQRVYGQGKNPRPLSLLEAIGYRKRLLHWYDHLPPPLRADRIVTPADLKLHMHLHDLVKLLFSGPVAMSLDGLDVDQAAMDASPGAIVAHSKTCYETIFRLFYLRHGSDLWDSTMIHYSVIAAFVALSRFQALIPPPSPQSSGSLTLQGVDRSVRQEALSSVMLCAQGLRNHARYSLLSNLIFRVIQDALSPADLALLKDHGIDLEPHESEGTQVAYLRSQYPLNVVSISDDPEAKRINAVIQASSRLTVSSSSDDDCPSPQTSSAVDLSPPRLTPKE